MRPTRTKPSRNANSLGVTQLNGLISDGFPLVGLIHICMPEPLNNKELLTIPFATKPLDVDNPEGNKGIFDDMVNVSYDWFPIFSTDSQMKRLLSYDIPKYAGISAVGLNFYSNGKMGIHTCSQDYWGFQKGYFNPHTKVETIDKISFHFSNKKNLYTTVIL
ncbi:MAG: hypothetical protein LPJ89_06715 [Hymenobacteraceae bacterium]|nr:hypothetical protein [Hymenobacteraceae bacterium]MDX5395198.1 hypothetical protein [Hymenobacteraceae bacterium]MDX5443463.1 hypothetical protein [Hymenobacteraceae bacterium]MDX5511236.1 hypothetical protein [Hymenobacteraceae bacterium]